MTLCSRALPLVVAILVACSSSFDPASVALGGTTWRATFSFEALNPNLDTVQCTGTVVLPITGDTTGGRDPEANLYTNTQDAVISCGGSTPTRWWLVDDVSFVIERSGDSLFVAEPGAGGGWFKAALKSEVRMEGGGPYYYGPGGQSMMGWPFTVVAVR